MKAPGDSESPFGAFFSLRRKPSCLEKKLARRRKKLAFNGLFLLALFAALILPRPTLSAEPEIAWKLQTPFIADTLWFKSAQMWAEDVSKMSGGRMKIDVAGSAFGADILGAVQQGIREAGYTSPLFWLLSIL